MATTWIIDTTTAPWKLQHGLDDTETQFELYSTVSAMPDIDDTLQIDDELMIIRAQTWAAGFVVLRGAHGTQAVAHAAGAEVRRLLNPGTPGWPDAPEPQSTMTREQLIGHIWPLSNDVAYGLTLAPTDPRIGLYARAIDELARDAVELDRRILWLQDTMRRLRDWTDSVNRLLGVLADPDVIVDDADVAAAAGDLLGSYPD